MRRQQRRQTRQGQQDGQGRPDRTDGDEERDAEERDAGTTRLLQRPPWTTRTGTKTARDNKKDESSTLIRTKLEMDVPSVSSSHCLVVPVHLIVPSPRPDLIVGAVIQPSFASQNSGRQVGCFFSGNSEGESMTPKG